MKTGTIRSFIVKEDYNAENYRNMGRKFIEDYYQHYKPFDDLRTIAIETVDFFPLDNGIGHVWEDFE